MPRAFAVCALILIAIAGFGSLPDDEAWTLLLFAGTLVSVASARR